jgi:hypothetical protein
MANHAHITNNGWFTGSCTGRDYPPMQYSRTATDAVIAQIARECVVLERQKAEFISGLRTPTHVTPPGRMRVPFASASLEQQQRAITESIALLTDRIESGKLFARELDALAKRVHGLPLSTRRRRTPPAPIEVGDQRIQEGEMFVATNVARGRVHWTTENGRRGWTGVAAWRRLAVPARTQHSHQSLFADLDTDAIKSVLNEHPATSPTNNRK